MKHPVRVFTLCLLGLSTAPPALASCNDADKCTAAECRHRQAHVHPICDQRRSCTNVLPSDRATLLLYKARNENCATAREYVSECFSVVDQGHQEAIDSALRAANTCQTKLGGE